MSNEQHPRVLSDEELRELPKAIAKVRQRLNWTQTMALILGAATVISGTVAVMDRGSLKYEREALQRLEIVGKSFDLRVQTLERDMAHTNGSVEARLKNIEEGLKDLSGLLRQHMNR